MAINFDLNDLLAFRAVAELGSFRKAAESVHISQPAFSRRIDKLESALGTRLLERTTRRVSLTAVGRDFDRQLRHILDALDTTLLGIRGVAATRMGEVTIASVPSAVNYFLSRVIAVYHERYPKIRVKIIDGSANDVLLAVARGEVDFGLNFIGSQEADVEFEPLLEEQFVAACRRDHPLAKKKQVRWTELAQYDYISAGKTSGNRLLIDQALAGLPGQPQSMYETQHGTTMIGLVEAGLGVAVVPSMAMPGSDHPLLMSVPLIDPVIKRKMGLIRRRSTVLSPAAQQFYALCAELQVKTKTQRTTTRRKPAG
ncbi:LysR family transcriptional regulator [Hydrogenophaga taeniospiralis]|uniref:LysR family transcriptional regulator n=1 Tax=Hydrogenophaga taeniospiralis TaxID=65656 RepID=UPI0008B3EA6B|nr:LysR family transcriptional regulator [Hydrogenophaga taeniospiralis]OGB14071.1 MAG: LysR family transcriptional regulator [Burkholderiales bacterium RIFCSPLOWO2_02_FULL_67_64]OGB38617.1 MAG: LysR family transcriptional regulator [Burkholderiales bacterium RIFCSPLOWO2_12_67_14]OGB45690.1 MAG: LysR family transcriptional regulator [Burkholderiales bacterium RIFCSPHIGHO2_12_FULL_67_38]OGB76331.1 MAG: LysR family transcriptional regulator [Burkholderiales bacterium RIFCSPLOWO2_12_FULL_67_210]M